MNRDPFRVPGEDLPWAVPFAALGVGSACSVAVVALITGVSAPRLEPPVLEPPAVVVAPSPSAAPSPSLVAPPPLTSSVASAAPSPRVPGDCAPLAVVFRSAADNVPTTALPALKSLAGWMAAHPATTALVHGHADARGDEDKNLALSKLRARNVSLVLAMDGVAKERLTVRGFGTYQPVEGVSEDASANRRVVVVIKGTAECPFAAEEVAGP